jgi:hypothetical protein
MGQVGGKQAAVASLDSRMPMKDYSGVSIRLTKPRVGRLCHNEGTVDQGLRTIRPDIHRGLAMH